MFFHEIKTFFYYGLFVADIFFHKLFPPLLFFLQFYLFYTPPGFHSRELSRNMPTRGLHTFTIFPLLYHYYFFFYILLFSFDARICLFIVFFPQTCVAKTSFKDFAKLSDTTQRGVRHALKEGHGFWHSQTIRHFWNLWKNYIICSQGRFILIHSLLKIFDSSNF